MNTVSMQPRLRVTNGKRNVVTVNAVQPTEVPTALQPGIYNTTYGTIACVVNPYIVWDVTYKQSVSSVYLIPIRIRRATYKELPEYYRDSGRDEVKVRGVWFDRTGKRKPRKW